MEKSNLERSIDLAHEIRRAHLRCALSCPTLRAVEELQELEGAFSRHLHRLDGDDTRFLRECLEETHGVNGWLLDRVWQMIGERE